MAVILRVALAITSLLLPLSVYPGVSSELAFYAVISSPLWLPAACLCWWAFADIAHEIPDLLGQSSVRRRRLAAAALVLVLNSGLLWSQRASPVGFSLLALGVRGVDRLGTAGLLERQKAGPPARFVPRGPGRNRPSWRHLFSHPLRSRRFSHEQDDLWFFPSAQHSGLPFRGRQVCPLTRRRRLVLFSGGPPLSKITVTPAQMPPYAPRAPNFPACPIPNRNHT